MNKKTDKNYRLPTEAEWEYACRAGGKNTYCGGGNDPDGLAWFEDNSGGGTHKAASKNPNAWGLYDMSGNVWEWVEDYYHDSYSGAPADGSAWNQGGDKRVLRGGSWYDRARFARAASRISFGPANADDVAGFRLARTLP